MKKFLMVGKWSAVLLLGAALLFAGCMGPSSDDSAIPAKAGGMGAKYVYKFSVNPGAQTLDIEPVVMGTAIQTTYYGGTVDISSSCAGYPLVCQIKFKNLTAGQYMSRVRTWQYSCKNAGIGCVESATATLSTSDYGSSLIASGTGGMCILEDGTWKHTDTIGPFNLQCPIYLYGGRTATLQYLHPDCGAITDTWTFANDSNPYQFYTALTDTLAGSTLGGIEGGMYPEDVTADSRFDPNHTTWVLKAYNLDNTWDGTQTAYLNYGCIGVNNINGDGYLLGAPGCSTPIAEGQTLAPGQYFAVAAGFEWPDRIENQNHGQRCKMTVTSATGPCNQTGLSCYEWPNETGFIYTFDGSVLEAVTVTTVTSGGTVIDVTAKHEIYKEGTTKKTYADINDGFNGEPTYAAESNYVYYSRPPLAGTFAFKTALFNTANCVQSVRENVARAWADPRPIATVGAIPDYRANGGDTGATGWPGLAEIYVNGATNRCDFRDLPQDADVDYWGMLQYFQVKPGAPSGSGSILKVEPHSGNSIVKWFQSNCTRGGGYLGDDLTGTWYWPCTGPPCAGTGSGTSTPTLTEQDPGNYMWESRETSNPNMPGGYNSWIGKGKNAQNDHICVQ